MRHSKALFSCLQNIFVTGVGLGAGNCTILQVGGVVPPDPVEYNTLGIPRYEYLLAGPPLVQISIAEPLAAIGETVLSPQAWTHVEPYVVEGDPIEERPDFHRLLALDTTKHTYATVKAAAMACDRRWETTLSLGDLNIARRYIQASVYKHIENGTVEYAGTAQWDDFLASVRILG